MSITTEIAQKMKKRLKKKNHLRLFQGILIISTGLFNKKENNLIKLQIYLPILPEEIKRKDNIFQLNYIMYMYLLNEINKKKCMLLFVLGDRRAFFIYLEWASWLFSLRRCDYLAAMIFLLIFSCTNYYLTNKTVRDKFNYQLNRNDFCNIWLYRIWSMEKLLHNFFKI